MISTPYLTLVNELGQPEGWRGEWAKRLSVSRVEEATVYESAPEVLQASDLSQLDTIQKLGWQVHIDAPRLNRLRIRIWKQHNPEQTHGANHNG